MSSICRKSGLGEVTPTVLKIARHTTLLILSHRIVARVQSAEPIHTARTTAAKEVAVGRHLADRGAPTLAPLQILAGPHVAESSVVTFWPYIEYKRIAEDEDAALAAASLTTVHEALQDFGNDLPSYTLALDRCWTTLNDDEGGPNVSASDRDLLKAEYQRLRDMIEMTNADKIPLHGDAHLGNLLIGNDGPIWLDFEEVCIGPREYDIACLPAETWPLFIDADQSLVVAYSHLRSVCVAVWCAAEIDRNAEICEATEYHLSRVRNLVR